MRRSPIITLLAGVVLAAVLLIVNHYTGAPSTPYPGR
jgi:hypothetical protein